MDVEGGLAPIEEIVIWVELTAFQKQCYKVPTHPTTTTTTTTTLTHTPPFTLSPLPSPPMLVCVCPIIPRRYSRSKGIY